MSKQAQSLWQGDTMEHPTNPELTRYIQPQYATGNGLYVLSTYNADSGIHTVEVRRATGEPVWPQPNTGWHRTGEQIPETDLLWQSDDALDFEGWGRLGPWEPSTVRVADACFTARVMEEAR